MFLQQYVVWCWILAQNKLYAATVTTLNIHVRCLSESKNWIIIICNNNNTCEKHVAHSHWGRVKRTAYSQATITMTAVCWAGHVWICWNMCILYIVYITLIKGKFYYPFVKLFTWPDTTQSTNIALHSSIAKHSNAVTK